ncbi:uncharacterized protein LOC127256429 [Andrographis paniculata]|uniref:uncharacterized protein LOC127256429 n=1 Tax=Andrographis paniculata TaxID=175694 RepID=UPI0021E74CE2|nr:uncharacterized protein LOC127256429 [Andrographis paniculata]XP_051138394.1 uncharacterized protein LOC127256429 [Andrographis paniculata]
MAEGRSPLDRDGLHSVDGFSKLFSDSDDFSESTIVDAFYIPNLSGSTTADTNPMVVNGFAPDSEREVYSNAALVRARRLMFRIPSPPTKGTIKAAPLNCSSTREVVIDMLRIYSPLAVEPPEYRVGDKTKNHLCK